MTAAVSRSRATDAPKPRRTRSDMARLREDEWPAPVPMLPHEAHR
jgi:hypothetical protein